jgi:hypothetical protein
VLFFPHISYDSWRSQAQLYWRSGTQRLIPQPIPPGGTPSAPLLPLVAFRDPPLFQTEPVLHYLRRRRPVLTIRLHPSLCLRYRNQSVICLSLTSLSRLQIASLCLVNLKLSMALCVLVTRSLEGSEDVTIPPQLSPQLTTTLSH